MSVKPSWGLVRSGAPTGGEAFRFLSLGAGLQSTTVLVMGALGLKGCPRIDAAIFADTQDEPAWVYGTLDFYQPWAVERGVVVERVTIGKLSDDLKAKAAGSRRAASIPAFTEGEDGRASILQRQCTREYKIAPIEKVVRRLLGYRARQRIRRPVEVFLGISLDEAHRMTESRTSWIVNRYPLIEAEMTRRDCEVLLAGLGLPIPQKSSCVYCPFHSDRFWADLQTKNPIEFQAAVEVDETIRNMTRGGVKRPAFLHRSLAPLATVDFTKGQLDFLDGGEECGGYCHS